MRIAILSGGTGWHVQDVLRAATELGHSAEIVDFRSLAAGVEAEPQPLAGFDAALVRTVPAGSLEQVIFRMDVLHAEVARGLRVVNSPRAVETCVDKYLTNVRLANAGLPTPPTHVAQRADDALVAFAQLGGDVVIKPVFGAEGRGMQRISDRELAWRTFRVLEQTGQLIYQQRFIHHPGYDHRVFVVAGKVRAAMRRIGTEWRTNVAQGGRTERAELSDNAVSLALRAAEVVGCDIAGVDLLPGPNGELYVIEVNAVPGWKALAPTCGIDVAKEIVRFVAEGRA
ncbi:MAG: 30S ribosomal protein S6--L-glutamate ligase [Planctomycetaceae bacterium]|nr:30S ribosomal protein S6--L-glutamate ligase [Planctomycetaceae bacterium]